MTTEQAAPQSEEKMFPRMLSHLMNEIADLRLKLIQPHLTVSLREHYEAKFVELEQLIRILEAWPTIKRTLGEYGNKGNWTLEDDGTRNLDILFRFNGGILDGFGYEPAQRALALVKPISRTHENGTEIKP